ncbi:sensor histidine kinase [Metabacillus litoralis]|uniref:sensor histidine kinase n=1 Tax=Metabacillus litoralis TaxID=152268 RepID=UPI0020419487|nr:ATP-binding protein [Metabacillus litoralis]MCM3654670.1 HAMP domain-containing histidine kinase [Metabacillus litoralis]
MNTSMFSFIRSFFTFHGKDMFSTTQRRLTRIYSGLLILFLALFIIIVYTVLYITILKSSERELESLVVQEANIVETYLLENKENNLRDVQEQEIVFAGVNQAFYYVMNTNGEIIMGNEDDSRLRPAILPLLNKMMINRIELLNENIHVEGNPKGRGKMGKFHHPEPEQDIRLMIASHSIYYKDQFVGQLFIGKDISFAYQLFNWVLVILVVLGIVFFGVAIFISQKMSKKAMIPITRAFTRQKEFVADASHELRTPLSVLLSSIDAMEMTIEPEEKEDFSGRIISNMRKEVKRMTNLVSDLLTLARSDSNTFELRRETFDFRPLAEQALESVSSLVDEKQISTSLSAPASLMAVGDPERLSQLLYILLDNAIKYTPNEGEVKLSLSKEGSDLCIRVQDTGIGIKQEDVHRIFERFYRSDKSRSRQIGSHGLGLSIAKWIVESHKGKIKVESELGKGSTFIVRVPDAST